MQLGELNKVYSHPSGYAVVNPAIIYHPPSGKNVIIFNGQFEDYTTNVCAAVLDGVVPGAVTLFPTTVVGLGGYESYKSCFYNPETGNIIMVGNNPFSTGYYFATISVSGGVCTISDQAVAGGYKFAGIYSPAVVALDDGYFLVLCEGTSTATIRVFVCREDPSTGIITVQDPTTIEGSGSLDGVGAARVGDKIVVAHRYHVEALVSEFRAHIGTFATGTVTFGDAWSITAENVNVSDVTVTSLGGSRVLVSALYGSLDDSVVFTIGELDGDDIAFSSPIVSILPDYSEGSTYNMATAYNEATGQIAVAYNRGSFPDVIHAMVFSSDMGEANGPVVVCTGNRETTNLSPYYSPIVADGDGFIVGMQYIADTAADSSWNIYAATIVASNFWTNFSGQSEI